MFQEWDLPTDAEVMECFRSTVLCEGWVEALPTDYQCANALCACGLICEQKLVCSPSEKEITSEKFDEDGNPGVVNGDQVVRLDNEEQTEQETRRGPSWVQLYNW